MCLEEELKEKEIKSPITGIFHDTRASIPYEKNNLQPYVKIGSHVIPEVIICDVEAIGVRIPIEAGVYGIIKEKLIKPEEAVEYNQPLFRIKTDK